MYTDSHSFHEKDNRNEERDVEVIEDFREMISPHDSQTFQNMAVVLNLEGRAEFEFNSNRVLFEKHHIVVLPPQHS